MSGSTVDYRYEIMLGDNVDGEWAATREDAIAHAKRWAAKAALPV